MFPLVRRVSLGQPTEPPLAWPWSTDERLAGPLKLQNPPDRETAPHWVPDKGMPHQLCTPRRPGIVESSRGARASV